MFKSRFQIAGEALAIAALSASALAQNPQAPINTLTDLEAALQACWAPPPMEQSRPGMPMTLWVSSAAVDQREVVAHVRFCSGCRHDDAQQRNDALCQKPTISLESARKHQAGLQSFRSMRRIEASRRNASALRLRFSQSLASLRQRLSQAKVRSTTQRRGSTTNPFVRSERLTISVSS